MLTSFRIGPQPISSLATEPGRDVSALPRILDFKQRFLRALILGIGRYHSRIDTFFPFLRILKTTQRFDIKTSGFIVTLCLQLVAQW